ncbi:MAG TPA: M23 family metallopeptidase [Terriglobales bacterium]|nr:M23 family metallopeptidase [Terriglobales bacterium]
MRATFLNRVSGRGLRVFVGLFLLTGCCKLWAVEAKAKTASAWSVQWQPSQLVNGSPVLFQVKSAQRLKILSGKWLNHDIEFVLNPKTRTWNAIAGVSLSVKPGTYTLSLSAVGLNGKDATFERRVVVRAGTYRSTALTVEGKYTAPSPEQQEIIARDRQTKQDTFTKVSAEREWDGSFQPPLDAPFSDTFGTTRTFNGQVRSTHEGLDFRAVSGTPITALNAGTVLLARPLYFEGNCVVLDHGQGLLTLYLHMSEFKVKEGDKVEKGQILGLVGGTGRATGPHLHIAVRWQGVYIDPATLLKMNLP